MKNIKFSFNQKIRVTRGFYKGFTGRIISVKENKDILTYTVELKLDSYEKKTVELTEQDLRPLVMGVM